MGNRLLDLRPWRAASRADPYRRAHELEGKGVGSRLVKEVLAHAREAGLRVIPSCKFVRSYLERHPDQQDVLAEPL